MIRYHFDLYPRDDPKNGTRLVRFTKLQSAEYRGEANGTGAGRFTIRADTEEAAFIDPLGLQYVRVVRDDGSTEKVVGGFWLDNGDFEALTTNQTRKLTFGGAGTLAYLQRAIIAEQTYISGAEGPYDDTWHWFYSTPGAILERMVTEAQEATRPQDPIPDVTPTFDVLTDSDGNNWGSLWEHWIFEARIGENLLDLTKRLLEHNLYVSMDPDTFELNAWDADTHRRDRTGASWGASVIRFQAPTSDDIATGNIKSDAKRGIAAFIKRSDMLVGDKGVYSWIAGTSDIDWEGFVPSQDEDGTSHQVLGESQLNARADAGDTLRLRMRLGSDPSNGYYRPFEDILLDDLATVHTGTGQWDYNEDTFPVAALTISLRPGGDWDAWADLGSTYTSMAERAFQVRGVASHSHPPNPQLCPPAKACGDLLSGDLTAGTAANGDAEDTGGSEWSGGSYTTSAKVDGTHAYGVASATSATLVYTFDAAQTFTAGVRYVLDFYVRRGATLVSRTKKFGVSGVDEVVTDEGPFENVTGADGETWAHHRMCWYPSADRTGVRLSFASTQDSSSFIYVDGVSLYTTNNDELAGTSNRAARCDHGHRAQDVTLRPPPGESWDDVQEAIDALAGSAAGSALGWFNVADYGAAVDDSTDDTAAIQDAYDAALAAGGGVVYFPGLCKITDTIDIHPANGQTKIISRGATRGNVTGGGAGVHMTTANTSAFDLDNNGDHSVFEDMTIRGPTGNSSGAGITATKAIQMHRCSVVGFYNGISLGAGAFYPKIATSFIFDADNAGIVAADAANNLDLWGTYVSSCAVGIDIAGMLKFAMHGGSVEQCTTAGIRVRSGTQDTKGVVIDAVYFENPSSTDIEIGDTADTVYSVTVRGCYFSNVAGTHNLDAQYVDGLTLIGNDFDRAGMTNVRTQSPATNVVDINNRYDGTTSFWETPDGLGGGALNDLSDATITSAAEGDMLRYNGSAWVNTPGRWEPVTTNPGTGPELVWDGDEIVMTWSDT